MNFVKVTRLNDLNTLVIKQVGDTPDLFITGENSIIISITKLAWLLKYLLVAELLSPKVIEVILQEYYDYKERLQ